VRISCWSSALRRNSKSVCNKFGDRASTVANWLHVINGIENIKIIRKNSRKYDICHTKDYSLQAAAVEKNFKEVIKNKNKNLRETRRAKKK
jgi:uncharacterized protein YaiI (UPF0178 family)